MKRLLFLFLLLLGCSEGPEVQNIVLTDNARIGSFNWCPGQKWTNNMCSDCNYHWGNTTQGSVYPLDIPNDYEYHVAPFNVTVTFTNMSTTTAVKIKVPANAFGWETLSPGEVYTPSNPMFTMNCTCEVDCPSPDYYVNVLTRPTFSMKVTNQFGDPTPVTVRVNFYVNSPHSFLTPEYNSVVYTNWGP